jgi:NTE family protein
MGHPVNIPKTLLLIAILALPFAGTAQQETEPITKDDQISIGLALSGGGAKGLAHIGVLKVFEEAGIPVHYISGTSMGAIIGSLYSIGYTPKEIEEIALSTNWNVLFNDNFRINPQTITTSVSGNSKDNYLVTFPFHQKRLTLPAGLIDGRNISMLLYRLMLPYHDVQDFTKLPIPFSTVATNLETGKADTFTEGYLPDAVRASIAIPSIFKPVKINGKTYIDGGVARNIPVEDVHALGADLLIASDVSEPVQPVDSLNTFVDVLFQSVGFHQQESNEIQKQKTDFYIQPDIKKFSSFSYDKAETIIKRGEQAARKVIPKIKEYLANKKTAPDQFVPISLQKGETIQISEVSFVNIEGLQKRQTELALDIKTPASLTLSKLEQKVNQLYESGLYRQISYRLQDHPNTNGKKLLLEFQETQQDFAGFSIRYDSEYKAALLFGTSFSDNLFWNDQVSLQLRAGEILEFKADYEVPVSLKPFSQFKFGLNFQRSPINFYRQNQALSTINVERITFRPSSSVRFLQHSDLEVGLEAEFYNLNQAVGNTLALGNTSFLLKPFVQFRHTTLNRRHFPTRGQSLFAKTVISNPSWGSISEFIQASGYWFWTFPLLKKLNISNKLFAGYSSTSNLPLHYDYYLGGLAQNPVFDLRQYPFAGHPTQQLRSSNFIALQPKLQYNVTNKIYLTAGMDWTHLSNTWTFNFMKRNFEYGYSLSAGANTILGPVELSLSTPDFSGGYALKINVGHNF